MDRRVISAFLICVGCALLASCAADSDFSNNPTSAAATNRDDDNVTPGERDNGPRPGAAGAGQTGW